MKRCVKCVMPDTRPGIKFDKNGVCCACLTHEQKDKIDWHKREQELINLCEEHKRSNDYDCIIAISGGKDSHFQTYVMKERMGMNPLLVSVEDNFPMTEAGKHNIKNISEEFGCNIISLKPNIQLQKKLMRKMFEEKGQPTWYIDRLIYTFPIHIAKKFAIPLVVYGENISYEYGGADAVETYSAKTQVKNAVAENFFVKEDPLTIYPNDSDLEPIYLSYFVPWDSVYNMKVATARGFKSLDGEWERTHHIENFDQIDSRAYLVHPWMKYPKFGHASATDIASRFTRYGLLTREEAMKLVEEKDHNLDQRCVEDFCEFLGYPEKAFWAIVDKFYNPKLFEKDGKKWRLKK